MRRWRCLFAVFASCIVPLLSAAHEVRPAYLEIRQSGPHHYVIVWKRPTVGDLALHLVPHLSTGWLEQPATSQYAAGDFLIRTWQTDAAPGESLRGATLSIEGLDASITDALVSVRWSNGERLDAILRPGHPQIELSTTGRGVAVREYLRLGFTHILSGPDHLLFVTGLLLLVGTGWRLLRTVTAFTAAHSLTLALTVMGRLRVPTSYVEALIALSILFLAIEIMHTHGNGDSLSMRRPWLVAFGFGLCHGMGFGSGLLQIGFPTDALGASLALFNIGVELGQLAFIAFLLAVAWAWSRSPLQQFHWLRALPAYAIGVGGAYWTIERAWLWLQAG